MSKTLKVGLIGPGSMAQLHADGIRRIPGVRLVSVAASCHERAKAVAPAWGGCSVCGDYRRLLDDKEIQVVHIATRNRTHCSIATEALHAGKHVVCEKPLGRTSAETSALLQLATSTGLVHALCYNLRFYPLVHHVRSLVRGGELGQVHSIHGCYLQDWLFSDRVYNWRIDPEESGPTRVLADIGTHWLDVVQFASGLQVTAVMGNLRTVVHERPKATAREGGQAEVQATGDKKIPVTTEDTASVLLDFQGQASGSLLVTQIAAGHKNRLAFEINGTKASAAWSSERPNELWLGYHDRPNQHIIYDPVLLSPEARAVSGLGTVKGIGDTWWQFLTLVYEQAGRGKPFHPQEVSFATFFDGDRDVRILEAILASYQQRTWVTVAK